MNPIKIFGKGITYLGFGALFLMSIVGSISIDIVILMAISKAANKDRHQSDAFVTGFLWGMLFSSNRSTERSLYQDARNMIIYSPFLTGIAVALSFLLGVPEIGVLLIAGWVGALGILIAGIAIHALGERLGDLVTTLINQGQQIIQPPTFEERQRQPYPVYSQNTPSVSPSANRTEVQPQPSTQYNNGFFPGYKTEIDEQQPIPSAPPRQECEDNPPAYETLYNA